MMQFHLWPFLEMDPGSSNDNFFPKNNERPETLSSPGRPGSPPPELLTWEVKRGARFCKWHFRASPSPKVPTGYPSERPVIGGIQSRESAGWGRVKSW